MAYREFYQAQAKERQQTGQKRGGQTGGRGRPTNSFSKNSYQIYNQLKKEEDTDDVAPQARKHVRWSDAAGAAAGVAHSTIHQAKRILDSGDEEVIAHAKAGEISLRQAEQCRRRDW